MEPEHSENKITGTQIAALLCVVCCFILAAIPYFKNLQTRGSSLSSPLNNAKQIHLAVFNMASDRIVTSDTTIGWPGDYEIHTVKELATTLVAGNYIQETDLKIFACGGIPYATSTAKIDATHGNAFRFTRLQETDPGKTIFLISRNWKGTLRSGTTIVSGSLTDDPPFQKKGLIVFRKAGDGSIYNPAQNQELFGICPKISTELLK